MSRTAILKRLTLPLAASLVLSTGLSGCFPLHQGVFEPPTLAEVGPVLNNYGEAVIPPGGRIVVQGDDLVYGLADHSRRPGINGAIAHRTGTSITETMRQALKGVTIVNEGYPGDTVLAGAQRWADAPVGNLLILSYSFGDAAAKTPIAAYTATLRALIRNAHAQGAAVFLLLPPPIASKTQPQTSLAGIQPQPAMAQQGGGKRRQAAAQAAQASAAQLSPAQVQAAAAAQATSELQSQLGPYSQAMREVGAAENAEVFDPAPDMTQLRIARSYKVAQTPEIYQMIAADLAPYIRIVQTPRSARSPTRR